MKAERDGEQGFTIIELVIATAIFSIVMILLITGVVAVTRMYYKGVINTQTQTVARSITDSIAEAIQFNGASVVPNTNDVPSGEYAFCVGGQMYTFVLGKELIDGASATTTQSPHVLAESNVGQNCTDATPPDLSAATLPTNSVELLSANMRLDYFNVCSASSGTNLYGVHIRIIYGGSDLLQPLTTPLDQRSTGCVGPTGLPENQCSGTFSNFLGGQFCAVSELDTTIEQRVVPQL